MHRLIFYELDKIWRKRSFIRLFIRMCGIENRLKAA